MAKNAIQKRHVWLGLAGFLVATAAGVPAILGASNLWAPRSAIPEGSQVNADPTGVATETASPAGRLLFASSPALIQRSEPSLVLSPDSTPPADLEPGMLNSAGGDRGAGVGSADATNTQGFAGGGERDAQSSISTAANSHSAMVSTGSPISPTAGGAIAAQTGANPAQGLPLGGPSAASSPTPPRLPKTQTEKPLSKIVSIAPGLATLPVGSADSTIAASGDLPHLATLTTQAVQAAAHQPASPPSTSTGVQVQNSVAHSSLNPAVDFTHSGESRGDGFPPIVWPSAGTAHPSEATGTNSVSLLDLHGLDVPGSARQGGGPAGRDNTGSGLEEGGPAGLNITGSTPGQGGPTGLNITGSTPGQGGPTLAELDLRPTEAEGQTVLATATNNFVALDAIQAAPMQAAAPNAIPEPTSLALLGLGLAGLAASRRRKSS